MALTDENGFVTTMPVAPMYGGGNGGFGGFGGDSWGWIILLLLCAGGGYGFGGGFGGGFGNMMLGYDFPWLLNGQNGINANTNAGFNQAATQSALGDLSNAVTSGFGDVQTALCGGFAGVNASINGAQNAVSQQLYTNQIADMERSFNAQTAVSGGIQGLSSQLAQCCCDNRLATCQTQNTIQNEGNATRYADANNTRDILTAISGGIQSIKDQLCSDKIEQKNDIINQLRSELMYARGQASQDVQTATIQAGQRALANEVEQYVAPKPIPAYTVQNPNCCFNSCGCGNF